MGARLCFDGTSADPEARAPELSRLSICSALFFEIPPRPIGHIVNGPEIGANGSVYSGIFAMPSPHLLCPQVW